MKRMHFLAVVVAALCAGVAYYFAELAPTSQIDSSVDGDVGAGRHSSRNGDESSEGVRRDNRRIDGSVVRVFDTSNRRLAAECLILSSANRKPFPAWQQIPEAAEHGELVAVRSAGYVGTRVPLSTAVGRGVVLAPAARVVVEIAGFSKRIRRDAIHAYLFPTFPNERAQLAWPRLCRQRQDHIDRKLGSVPREWAIPGLHLDRWERQLQPSIVEIDDNGVAVFASVVPHLAYRVGFLPTIGLTRIDPPIDHTGSVSVVQQGGQKVYRTRPGFRYLYTQEFTAVAGQTKSIAAEYALGTIVGRISPGAEVLRLKLFERVPNDVGLVHMREVSTGAVSGNEFVYTNCKPGKKEVQAAWRAGGRYWLCSQAFEFSGGTYDLGTLSASGTNQLSVRLRDLGPESRGAEYRLSLFFQNSKKGRVGYNRLELVVHPGAEISVMGVHQDRCSLEARPSSSKQTAVHYQKVQELPLGPSTVVELVPVPQEPRANVTVTLRGLGPDGGGARKVNLLFIKNSKLVREISVSVDDVLKGKMPEVSLPSPPVRVIAHCHQSSFAASQPNPRVELSSASTWKGGDAILVNLAPSYTARFRLLDAQGRPDAGAQYQIVPEGCPTIAVYYGRADKNGEVALSCFPPGTAWRVFGYRGKIAEGLGVVALAKGR